MSYADLIREANVPSLFVGIVIGGTLVPWILWREATRGNGGRLYDEGGTIFGGLATALLSAFVLCFVLVGLKAL